MKRLLLICGLMALFAVPAAFAGTSTVTGSASMFSYFSTSFTSAPGTVSVTADFVGQNNSGYQLILYRDGVQICNNLVIFHGNTRPARTGSSVTCSDTAGPGGSYTAEFGPNDGKPLSVTLTITTP